MSNNSFLPTGFTVTAGKFTQLSEYLNNAGIPTGGGAVASQDGFIRNNSTTIDLYIGQGDTGPDDYATVGPKSAILFNAGLNPSLVWVKSASSTVAVDFVEGASAYSPPLINGVIGEVTATENQVPKADADGNLVASSISDTGSVVTITGEDLTVNGSISGTDLGVSAGVIFGGASSGSTGVVATAIASGTLTLPAATDTLVGKATTDTLTNKTLTAAVLTSNTVTTKISPTTDDGAPLGDTTHNFSDLFLASGALLNFANGNSVITHSSAILTVSTGDLRVTTAGTNSASVVTVGGAQTLTSKGLTTPTINGGAALGSTSTEIDQLNDVSAYQESIIAAGALSVTKVYSGLSLVGAGAVTLAAPSATMLGQQKIIEMVADNGDVTLSLANCEGGTAATTCTWTNPGEKLIVIAGASKWTIIKQFGVVLT